MQFFHRLNQVQQGEIYALLAAISWGIFAPAAKVGTATVPFFWLAACTFGIAAVATFIWGVRAAGFWSVWQRATWRDFVLMTFLNLIGYFGLTFYALTLTSSGNVALLGNMEIIFTVFFFWFWGERLTLAHFLGVLVTLCGAILVLLPHFSGQLIWGDWLIVGATLLPVFGNYFQKRLLKTATIQSTLFWRNLLASGFFGILAFCWQPLAAGGATLLGVWPWLLLSGIISMFISKIFFMASLRQIGVARTMSIHMIAPAASLLAAYFWLGEVPTIFQFAGLITITFGVWLSLRPAREPVKSLHS